MPTPFATEFGAYDAPGWDGYGGNPISPETVAQAEVIHDMLIAAGVDPWPAPGGDGSIGFEFTFAGQRIFLDVTGSTISGHVKSPPKPDKV